jgi:transcriptional regulator GlxA family with amidase domain
VVSHIPFQPCNMDRVARFEPSEGCRRPTSRDSSPDKAHKLIHGIRFDTPLPNNVRERLAGDIRQAEIPRTLHLSPPAFSRFLMATTGRTFVTFINTLRVSEVCRLLNNSSMSVTEIAMACGFNNVSNFNRQFLALKGVNPSEYRQRIRQKSEHHSQYLGVHATL